jgi:divalent metal cation (Fe/Co/Zn/Cd) transporter
MRTALIMVAVLVGVGFLVFARTGALRALGATTAVLVAAMIKAVSELAVRSNRVQQVIEREAERELQRELQREVERGKRTQELLEVDQNHSNSLEIALAGVREAIVIAESRGDERLEHLRAETNRRLEILTASVDDLVAAHKAARRHPVHPEARLRELSLSDSLDALSPNSE